MGSVLRIIDGIRKAGGITIEEPPPSTPLVITSAGFLGIGVVSPSYRLDIAGTARVTGLRLETGSSNGYVLTSDAAGNATWQASSGGIGGSIASTQIAFGIGANTIGGSNSFTWINGTERLGIGPTAQSTLVISQTRPPMGRWE